MGHTADQAAWTSGSDCEVGSQSMPVRNLLWVRYMEWFSGLVDFGASCDVGDCLHLSNPVYSLASMPPHFGG